MKENSQFLTQKVRSKCMYEFITGPLLWVSFLLFFMGSFFKLAWFLRLSKKDKVVFPHMGLHYCIPSFFKWLFCFFNFNIRKHPVLAIITVVFHVCLFTTPIFLFSHNLLWYQSWNISWWSLPENVTDIMAATVIISCMFFFFRRLLLVDVQYVTSLSDYLLLIIVLAPFITGFLSYHQWLPYKIMLTVHILSGQLFLISIPFTRLSHMLFIFFTQAYMGSEFDAVRYSKDKQ